MVHVLPRFPQRLPPVLTCQRSTAACSLGHGRIWRSRCELEMSLEDDPREILMMMMNDDDDNDADDDDADDDADDDDDE
jgi:hypothetical protein